MVDKVNNWCYYTGRKWVMQVFLITIAAYILFITLILFIATRALWLVFLLFCYRFFEGLLPYEKLVEHIGFKNVTDYHLFIFILSLVVYFAVVVACNTITTPILKYIFLVVMMLYVFKKYDFHDIFLFKDYLEAKGMWGLDYWVEQLKSIFTTSVDDKKDVFKDAWDGTMNFFKRLWSYVSGA